MRHHTVGPDFSPEHPTWISDDLPAFWKEEGLDNRTSICALGMCGSVSCPHVQLVRTEPSSSTSDQLLLWFLCLPPVLHLPYFTC